MNLSPRLKRIADFIPNNSIVADVGTDHGYVPKYLIDKGISKLVIATDISKGSLQKTVDYIREENLEEEITTRLGDGLDPIRPFEVDTLVIAGMGGLLIAEIMSKSMEVSKSINTLILQPMVGSPELRKYLLQNNFRIVDEDLVREGDKFYEIIVAKTGLQKFDKELDYEISPVMLKKKNSPVLREFVEMKIKMNENVIEKLRNRTGEKSMSRLLELEKIVEDYREVFSK
ncbi:tRNA (adenine(22)-N(1))-methyltransferase [Gudongella sp. DL1XJH-153]|uniref:tRNA (adenine(22)-N(1))-methyltransferase n=1 Tax=Gudongella sp. DL1XJH-153 TaxID=3409804 RepID=UPI003BB6A56A